MTKALTKESPLQRRAFIVYFDLGEKRSQKRLKQELSKTGVEVSETSIAKWSIDYNWVKRVEAMDKEVYDRTEKLAIKKAMVKKSQILQAVKNTMIAYNRALMSGDTVPTARDFKAMWEIARKELGLDIAEKTSVVKIQINPRVLQVITKAEHEAKEILEAEIVEEK